MSGYSEEGRAAGRRPTPDGHRPEFAHLPPEQIVVRLLDEEQCYLGSVSSFYRVLRRHGELTGRFVREDALEVGKGLRRR